MPKYACCPSEMRPTRSTSQADSETRHSTTIWMTRPIPGSLAHSASRMQASGGGKSVLAGAGQQSQQEQAPCGGIAPQWAQQRLRMGFNHTEQGGAQQHATQVTQPADGGGSQTFHEHPHAEHPRDLAPTREAR